MFPPMHVDAEYDADGTVRKPGQDYYLKPMNCPMHCLSSRRAAARTASSRCAVRVRLGLPLRRSQV